MRVLVTVLVAACTLFASANAVGAAQDSIRAVPAVQGGQLHKRLLRADGDAAIDAYGVDGEDYEERSIASMTKDGYMALKIGLWINKGLLPNEVAKKLKINGLLPDGAAKTLLASGMSAKEVGKKLSITGEKLTALKKYKYLEKYRDLWIKMDQPVHVSPSYHAKMRKNLKHWFNQKFESASVLSQLNLIGSNGKVLTGHKNYPYYIQYLDMLSAANKAF